MSARQEWARGVFHVGWHVACPLRLTRGFAMASAYVTREELARLGINPAALVGIDDATQDEAIAAASSEADGFLATRYTTPLTSWPDAMKVHVARMAAYHLLTGRGFSPDGDDELLLKNYELGLKYFKLISNGVITLSPVDTAPPEGELPAVGSQASEFNERGWETDRI